MTDFLAPRPFYRSRVFWLGLTFFPFLLCFWLVFSSNEIYISAGTTYTGILSFRSATEFIFANDNLSPSRWYVDVQDLEEEDRVDRNDPVFKLGNKSWGGESIVGGRSQFIFYRMEYLSMRPWLPSVAYLVVWLAAVWGWQRRKARLFKAAALPPP